jgi:hypothetical protein
MGKLRDKIKELLAVRGHTLENSEAHLKKKKEQRATLEDRILKDPTIKRGFARVQRRGTSRAIRTFGPNSKKTN